MEQISGSLELAADYERAKKEVERAAENATESFNKRRGFAGEIRVFKEQLNEAERFEGLVNERVITICASVCFFVLIVAYRMSSSSSVSFGNCSILRIK